MTSKTLEEMSPTELLDALRDNKREAQQLDWTERNFARMHDLVEECENILEQIERVIELEVESE